MRVHVAVAALAIFAWQARAEPAVSVALLNPGFEEAARSGETCAPGWSCTMHNDPHSFRFFYDETHPLSGSRSLCIEPSGHETWALASQGTFDVVAMRGTHVRFSAAVRLDSVTGEGAGPIAHVQGGSGQIVAHGSQLEKGTRGWERVAVEIDVPRTASFVEVGLMLQGAGRACMDDTRLEIMGPARGPV